MLSTGTKLSSSTAFSILCSALKTAISNHWATPPWNQRWKFLMWKLSYSFGQRPLPKLKQKILSKPAPKCLTKNVLLTRQTFGQLSTARKAQSQHSMCLKISLFHSQMVLFQQMTVSSVTCRLQLFLVLLKWQP